MFKRMLKDDRIKASLSGMSKINHRFKYIYTRTFKKVAAENVSALREMTPNHRFYGPGKVQHDKREKKEGRGEERRKNAMHSFVSI